MSNLNLIFSLLPSVDLALPQGLRAKKSATGWRKKESLAPFLEQALWVKNGEQEEEERQNPSYITDNL